MRNAIRFVSNQRRRRFRLELLAMLCVGGINASLGFGQSGQYPFAGNYPSQGYESQLGGPYGAQTPRIAQNPYAPQQPNPYELPPPAAFSNPQGLNSGYAAANPPSDGNNFIQANPSEPYAPTKSFDEHPQQQTPGTTSAAEESTNSELVIAESLGPEVLEESWIHGSWMSFCKAGCMAGIEGTFLAIQTDSLRSVVATDLIGNRIIEKTPQDGFGAGYRTWLGMQRDSVGFRVSYWSFEDSFYEPSPSFVPWNSFAFYDSSMLRAQTIDVEFLQLFCFSRSWIETSLGARYAGLDRSGLLQGAGKLGAVNLLGSSATNSQLEGWGGVASIGGLIPIFCKDDLALGCYNPWSFFWKCQGAALQSQSKVQAITLVSAIAGDDKFANAYSKDEAIADWEGMIGMGMLQVGLDYRCPISWIDCQPASVHLRSGFEGQYWQTGHIGTRSQSAATLAGDFNNIPFGGAIGAKADANPEDLVLLGFFISASLSY